MIGQAVAYAASRATEGAIESVSRRLFWWLAAALFFVGGLAFGLVATYWYLAPRYGSFEAAALIAAGCLCAALIALCIPPIVNWISRLFRRPQDIATATAEVVQEEAREAVDYFGAAKVMATAFMFGLGAARRLRG